MKRLFCILLIAALMLCGCSKPQPPVAPEPVFNTAPTLTGEGITVCGKDLGGVYSQGETKYIKLKELAAALGGSADIYEDITDHQAKLSVSGTDYLFTTSPDGLETYKNCLYDGSDWYSPMEEILSVFELSIFYDEQQKHTYYTDFPKADEIPEGYSVPTLMYHAVSDNCWGIESLFVSPSDMEAQLQYLTENGYTPIWFEDLESIDKIEKPVLLTFDDGYDDNYTELFPLLKKYNVKATVFMITGSIGDRYYLTQEQIKEMSESGLVSFQSHTVTHPYLDTLGDTQLESELVNSKAELARITGKESFVLCYPSGRYSQASLDVTREHYQFGLLMSGTTYVTGADPVRINRKYVSRSTSLDSFKNMIG